MNILALDIGKYNTVFCDYVCGSGEHEFGRVKTTPQAIHDLIVSNAKNNTTAFTNFNISVKVRDAFMKQLEENQDTPHVVINPRNKKKYNTPQKLGA
jgi:ribonucleotide reductase alpha subunit